MATESDLRHMVRQKPLGGYEFFPFTSSGNGAYNSTATTFSGATLGSGSITFGAESHYVSAAGSAFWNSLFSSTGSYTICCYFRPTNTSYAGFGGRVILSLGGQYYGGPVYGCHILMPSLSGSSNPASACHIEARTSDSYYYEAISKTTASYTVLNLWNFVCVRQTGTTLKIAIRAGTNAIAHQTFTGKTYPVLSSYNLRMGAQGAVNVGFTGALTKPMFFNRELTDAEVLELSSLPNTYSF